MCLGLLLHRPPPLPKRRKSDLSPFLFFFFFYFGKFVLFHRRDDGRGGDARDLRPKVILLRAGKGRVRENFAIQIAGEELLDQTRVNDLRRRDVRQLDPGRAG